jgi:hypothetical protein
MSRGVVAQRIRTALSGKMCPGRERSDGSVLASASARSVAARSDAEIPAREAPRVSRATREGMQMRWLGIECGCVRRCWGAGAHPS